MFRTHENTSTALKFYIYKIWFVQTEILHIHKKFSAYKNNKNEKLQIYIKKTKNPKIFIYINFHELMENIFEL